MILDRKNCFVGMAVLLLVVCSFIGGCDSGTGSEGSSVGVCSSAKSIVGDMPFDDFWHFHRGDIADAEQSDFNDSDWRVLDLPHDWSIEDLPPVVNEVPQFLAVDGKWLFVKGDDPAYSMPEFDDSAWQVVSLPANWEEHSSYTGDNIYGWYRKTIAIPEDCRAGEFDILLGAVDDVDETWLNGVKIGATGTFPPDYKTAWDTQRCYRVPAGLVRADGDNVLAVRVFDGSGNGGINQGVTLADRVGPFSPSESPSTHFTGNTVGGTSWYRKSFTVDSAGKRVAIRFDGVYMNSQVWINGHLLGDHPYGYTNFEYDLTDHLKGAGEENIIAVKVRNEGRNSRWYSGSGIFRHVWLVVNDPVHIPTWGVVVKTPEVAAERAVVSISAEVSNTLAAEVEAIVSYKIIDKGGSCVATGETAAMLGAGDNDVAGVSLEVAEPSLWQLEEPYLYTAEVSVIRDDKILDVVCVPFGIRTIEVDSVNGFRLNGKETLLKGGCIHHDNGPLGSAAIDRAEYRKMELLKANGYNAIRCSHNPPSSALLEACDELGMLVIDEAFDQWNYSKENNPQDYNGYFNDWYERDIASMVCRDRNHPSVIMWSIGNEIPEQYNAVDTQRKLREAVLAYDDSRPITQAISRAWGEILENWDTRSDVAFEYLDVAGYNYLPEYYERDHSRVPERVILTTESYPKDTFEYWSLVEKHPYVIGDFVWTAMDYLGEAGLAHSILSNEPDSFFMPWPWFNAWCGDLDLCGFKKPQSYYRDVVWGRSKVEMAVHAPVPEGLHEILSWWAWSNELRSWNWSGQEGRPLQVTVYSSCDSVRLELNGKVIGEKPVSAQTKLTAAFDVPYAPGELKAYGLENGDVVAETSLVTTGKPFAVRLSPDRVEITASRNDLCYVAVEIVDDKGRLVPDAELTVGFEVSGVGELAGHASAVPNEPASFHSGQQKTYQGRCMVVLRPMGNTGVISLNAQVSGFSTSNTEVWVR